MGGNAENIKKKEACAATKTNRHKKQEAPGGNGRQREATRASEPGNDCRDQQDAEATGRHGRPQKAMWVREPGKLEATKATRAREADHRDQREPKATAGR